ncbi:hypothetical protein K461DRAFT_33873 [Myriangium duriaei CBS 260.36]|uniref:Secreted protein n=1 Tax=Myriangium duriaei CBS 260.36 TaxID=1168546 RepID=A0A9P4ITL8_9PEZI|nr:hypothetical protein K461DRAFT_33873 [Myriangium duriaei CBS 260.36]
MRTAVHALTLSGLSATLSMALSSGMPSVTLSKLPSIMPFEMLLVVLSVCPPTVPSISQGRQVGDTTGSPRRTNSTAIPTQQRRLSMTILRSK